MEGGEGREGVGEGRGMGFDVFLFFVVCFILFFCVHLAKCFTF